MKKRYIRELVPYAATGMLLVASIVASNNSQVTGDIKFEKINECYFPTYNNENSQIEMKSIDEMDILVVELEERPVMQFNQGNPVVVPVTDYVILKPEEVNNIVYSDNNESLTITLKDSDVYYLGTYDNIEKKYFYTQYGEEKLIEVNDVKKLTKK